MASMPSEECARRPGALPPKRMVLHGPDPTRVQPNTRLRCDATRTGTILVHSELLSCLCSTTPFLVCVSADPGGDRHAETCHPVQHIASDLCLSPLIGQNPRVKSSADNGLIAKHRRLNQTPAIIARASLPAHASVLCNGREMFVALRGFCFTCNGRNPWWNNDRRFWITLGRP